MGVTCYFVSEFLLNVWDSAHKWMQNNQSSATSMLHKIISLLHNYGYKEVVQLFKYQQHYTNLPVHPTGHMLRVHIFGVGQRN